MYVYIYRIIAILLRRGPSAVPMPNSEDERYEINHKYELKFHAIKGGPKT